MADILRFPGDWQQRERSADSRAVGAIIAHCVDAVIQTVREKQLKVNLQLDADIAASAGQPGCVEAITTALDEASKRAPVGSTIDILGSQSSNVTEIEISDEGDDSSVLTNNAMSRPFESGVVIRQVLRLPQGGTSTLIRLCRVTELARLGAGDATESTAATARKAA
ncbi:MAG: hypothetical protein Aurels2KO_19110 [Aureliella sp.]